MVNLLVGPLIVSFTVFSAFLDIDVLLQHTMQFLLIIIVYFVCLQIMMPRLNLKVLMLLLIVGAGFFSLTLWAKCGHDIGISKVCEIVNLLLQNFFVCLFRSCTC
jgi:hypothetical protein